MSTNDEPTGFSKGEEPDGPSDQRERRRTRRWRVIRRKAFLGLIGGAATAVGGIVVKVVDVWIRHR
ncbi:hypothetical protein [Kitasatospora sp. KL5]|uniref:hypothetical protein n=1 Tax=Kitasatospora sp. KL5 TaxID=3425125 RepID=UPI003D6F9CD5